MYFVSLIYYFNCYYFNYYYFNY